MNKEILLNKKVLILLIILYPLLFIWQGLDFTDVGYALTNYQLIFKDPASVQYSFILWLTNVIGGIWVYFFGNSLGLVGIRLASVLILYATLYFTYLILKSYIKKEYLLLGLFFTVIFTSQFNWLNYNNLSALFFTMAAYFLQKGLQEKHNLYIFIASFILGLNIFVRFPNILGFSLLAFIYFYGFHKKNKISVQFKQSIFFVVGYSMAILTAIISMKILGHYDFYIKSLNDLLILANDTNGSHSKAGLLNLFIKEHILVFQNTLLLFVKLLIITIFISITYKLRNKYLKGILITFITLISFYYYYENFQDRYTINILVVGVLYTILTINIFKFKKDKPEYQLVNAIALLLLIITPLGSNNGLYNSIYGMYLALPIVINYLINIKEITINLKVIEILKRNKIIFAQQGLNTLKILILGLFLFFTVKSDYQFTYRDSTQRLDMLYGVDSPMLRGVLTTKDRAEEVRGLLNGLEQYVKKDDYLLSYEDTSMVYFLTQTKPYLYNAWPEIYPSQEFYANLNRAINERPYLPVVVRAKAATADPNWPHVIGLSPERNVGDREIIKDFLIQYNYSIVWENNFFEILKPN